MYGRSTGAGEDVRARGVPISDPLASPIHAPDFLLAKLPPMLLRRQLRAAGGRECVLRAEAAKDRGRAVVEVWQGMWHDFIQVRVLVGA